MRLCHALTILAVVITFTQSTLAEDSPRWKDEPGKHFDILTPDGKPLVRYEYARDKSTPESTFNTGKVFHQVFDADGKGFITKGAGGLFPHHRGLFIGWNEIKLNDESYDLWHVKNTEQIHMQFSTRNAHDDHTNISVLVNWRTADETLLIEELRTIRVYFNDEDAHALIDFESTLKAMAGDLELNGDPEHAGMQYRPSQDVAENKSARYLFPEGVEDVKEETDLPWVALTYNVGDNVYTVQHMNHPSNPKGTKYSAYRDYGRFGAFPVVNIKQHKIATVRYRIRITHGEAPSREELQKQYEKYAGDGKS